MAFELPFALNDALGALREASDLALALRPTIRVEVKADDTLVTNADRQVEALLRTRLQQLAPAWSFLGEEGGLRDASTVDEAPCWAIDPIDGTTNYARDLPLWCVSVGAVWRGEAVLGLLAVPSLGQTLWAVQGNGAWLQEQSETRKLSVPDITPLHQEDLLAVNTTVERVLDFSDVPCRLRNFGALAYHLAALGRGSVAGAIAHYHKLYDVAAGLAICSEAGCVARYLDGTQWRAVVSSQSDTQPLFCAPPRVMDELLGKLRPKLRQEAVRPEQQIA